MSRMNNEFGMSTVATPISSAIATVAAAAVSTCLRFQLRSASTTCTKEGRPARAGERSARSGRSAVVIHPVCHVRSEEHTSELQSRGHLVCRLLLEKKKKKQNDKGATRCQ